MPHQPIGVATTPSSSGLIRTLNSGNSIGSQRHVLCNTMTNNSPGGVFPNYLTRSTPQVTPVAVAATRKRQTSLNDISNGKNVATSPSSSSLMRTLTSRMSTGKKVIARPEDVTEIREFSEWILKVGDGELGEPNDGEVSIDLPDEIVVDASDDPVTSIIDFTYPNILDNINDPSYF
ncbi:ATP-dependent DNA helicase PIF1-like protein [Tanacetum coccineum]